MLSAVEVDDNLLLDDFDQQDFSNRKQFSNSHVFSPDMGSGLVGASGVQE